MALVGLVAACAQAPELVQPAYVSPVVYDSWSCRQIAEESARLETALETASQQQLSTRSNDIAAVIFLGMPLASMSGGNVAPQIARYKGEQEAVRIAAISHRCFENPQVSLPKS